MKSEWNLNIESEKANETMSALDAMREKFSRIIVSESIAISLSKVYCIVYGMH